MQKNAVFILLVASFLALGSLALAGVKTPLSLPVKELYSAPSEDSNLIYQVPVEVKLLDISEDGNWYKVKLSYAIGPFSYSYVGWANIPIQDFLSSRSEKLAKVPPKDLP